MPCARGPDGGPGTAPGSMLAKMRSAALALVVLGSVLGSAARAWGEDAPGELCIEAREQEGGPGGRTTVTVTIAPDGAVRSTWESPRLAGGKPEVVEFRLSPDDMARARDAVVAGRFFESWSPSPPVDDGSTWAVSVHLGGQELRRSGIRYPPEFEPLRRYLDRFVQQASITAGLRRGDYRAAGAMPYGYFPGVAHLPSIVDELVACAARQTTPTRCAEAADLLFAVAGSADWLRPAQDLLARLEGDCRAAVLAAWTDRLHRPENADRRAAFAPTLLAEAESSAPRWASLTPQEKGAFDAMLGRLLLDGVAPAFELAERMARTTGELGKPFVPPGLVETGGAAVPLVVRLMDAEEAQARANAVQTAYVQIGVLRVSFGLRERLSDASRAVLERRVGEEVIPALERRLRDPAESYEVRRTCVTLLDWWDGRCKAAQARALEREAESRRRESAAGEAASLGPPSPGSLVIAGRLLGPFDAPLPGFTLLAVRGDGRLAASAVTGDSGSFRVEGLAEGTYDLVEVAPGEPGPYLPKAPRAAESVAAGRDGVVLRLPGSMVRGRLLDPAGAPVARFSILAQPRGSPSEWPLTWNHRANTDAAGRFWFVRLPPGVYDVVARDSGPSSLRGGVGVEAGPEERTVEAQAGAPIVGRLVDEAGAPVAAASVQLFDPDPVWFSYRSAKTSADGSFRFEGVDPLRDHRLYSVATGTDGAPRGVIMEGVRGGGEGLVLRVGASPRLRFRVDLAGRGPCESDVRIVRIAGGPVVWHRFAGSPVDWPAAPSGSWRVLVRARDLDAEGVPRCVWVEVGTVTTGEPEKTLAVPR